MLNAARLVQISNTPHLKDSWHIIAAATLSVCNRPQESSKILHYALKKAQYEARNHPVDNEMSLAQEAILRAARIKELSALADKDSPELQFSENIFRLEESTNHDLQLNIARQIREAILKSLALGGIPKAINTLMDLRNATPEALRETEPCRDFAVDKTQQDRQRGQEYWNKVYKRLSGRITHQMNSAYPDLWEYTINHVYGPLLSFSDILPPSLSSLVIIACLIPQDVNPQLKGHLKGALNNGATREEIDSTRDLAIQIGEWCGITWKEQVVKLRL